MNGIIVLGTVILDLSSQHQDVVSNHYILLQQDILSFRLLRPVILYEFSSLNN
jgi:hypothetical protein